MEAFVTALLIALAVFAVLGVAVWFIARWLFTRAAEQAVRHIDRALTSVGGGAMTHLRAYATARGIPVQDAEKQFRDQIEQLVWWTEGMVKLPIVGKVGLDALLGLVPFVGDAATTGMGLMLVVRAIQFGAPPALVSKMLANVLTDFLFGMVPLVGDLVDIWFRANTRNAALLREYLGKTD